MALIKCSDCGKEISTDANTCIHCGKPIKEYVQTIQQTSKRWKIVKLIAGIGIIIGFIIFMANVPNGGLQNTYADLGANLAIYSFILFLIGKFGGWWTNK